MLKLPSTVFIQFKEKKSTEWYTSVETTEKNSFIILKLFAKVELCQEIYIRANSTLSVCQSYNLKENLYYNQV